jgi:hypothetical protein
MDYFFAKFGHLLPYGEFLDAFATADWKRSTANFRNGRCNAALVMGNTDLIDYLENKKPNHELQHITEILKNNDIHGPEGIALANDARSSVLGLLMRPVIRAYSGADFFWGLAHTDLNNMGFWGKHSIPLGIHSGENSHLFVIPLTQRALVAFSKK